MTAARAITTEAELRAIVGTPTELVAAKIAERLNDLTRQFIERSPLVCVATADPDGGLDVSPRGDPAGFVRIIDERTLLIPLLAPSAVGGRVPKLGILVSIEEAFTQCPKALVCSELWNPERHVERSELPRSGDILRSVADPQLDADQYERGDGLY